jgi:hypothetical protein
MASAPCDSTTRRLPVRLRLNAFQVSRTSSGGVLVRSSLQFIRRDGEVAHALAGRMIDRAGDGRFQSQEERSMG